MEKEIIWTKKARNQFFNILEYWKNRNKSYTYPEKILQELEYTFTVLKKTPHIGKKSTIDSVLLKTFKKHFIIVYEFNQTEIIILNFWDTRQNPKRNKYIKND